MELINKIQELGFLKEKLLHSMHGREFITPARLCQEVKQLVGSAGGRLAIVSTFLKFLPQDFCRAQ